MNETRPVEAAEPAPFLEPFGAFVDQARRGPNSPGRIVAGTILVVIVAAIGMVGLVTLGSFAIGFGWIAEPFGNDVIGNDVFSAFLGSRAFLAVAILALGAIWPGVWLAVRLLHKRRLATVLGASGRIARGDFTRAFAATAIVAGVGVAASFGFDPTIQRSAMPVGAWLAAIPVLVAILLVQTSAEELMFRGYLLQSLAARHRSPLVWGVVPGLLFAVLHWNPAASAPLLAVVIGAIAVFAFAATVLVYVTGNLGAAMGMHFANNIVAFLLISSDSPERALALYVSRPLEDSGWSTGEVAALAIGQLAITGVILLLLLHDRSPLRVARRMPQPPASRWG